MKKQKAGEDFSDRWNEFGFDSTLIDCKGNNKSFADLASYVHYLGDLLLESGINSGDRVAVLQHKSIENVIVILALEECGITYVPIDPDAPLARIEFILADCKPKALIADRALLPQKLTIDLDICNLINEMGQTVASLFPSEETNEGAYILYTSGSTGNPKGVCVSNEAASAFVAWGKKTFGIDRNSILASIAPFHFDLSVFDIYSLTAGATLHLFDSKEVKNPRLVCEQLQRSKVNVIYATPTFFMALQEFGKIEKCDWSHLKTVLFAGEVFPVKQLHALMNTWKHAKFYNLYGPTETNVCTFMEIQKDESRTEPYPIGKPCPDHLIEIADDGELFVGGPHVADGYLNNPALTAERFFTRDNVRWFRTGDKVERDQNGMLLYKGRIDRMIKRRGYRIEPGEIEAALNRISGITAAAVISQKGNDVILLAAVITTDGTRNLDILQLKAELALILPDYMLPDSVVTIESFPKTSSGKIDYMKLQEEIVSSLRQ